MLRVVERQLRAANGWRGRFVVEDGPASRPVSMRSWFYVGYKKWWFWPSENLGIAMFGTTRRRRWSGG